MFPAASAASSVSAAGAVVADVVHAFVSDCHGEPVATEPMPVKPTGSVRALYWAVTCAALSALE